MKESLVSIIIPLYNSEKYIAEAIRSAIGQTWLNKEIIVIDDGSTDNSLAIAKSFENEIIKVFHQENKGASGARNKGLSEARGEYIQFLDADDLISPNKIEEQVIQLKKKPGSICTCGTVYFFENEDPYQKEIQSTWMSEGSTDPIDFLSKLYGGDVVGRGYGGMVAVHSWLCPKSVLEIAGPWNEELSIDDDGEYFCRVILASKGITYTHKAISYYRKHLTSKSLSANLTLKTYTSLLKAIDLKYQYLKNLCRDSILFDRIFAQLYWSTGVSTYPQFKNISNEAIYKAKALGYDGPKYHSGPISNLLVKLLGWRMVRRLNYYRHKL